MTNERKAFLGIISLVVLVIVFFTGHYFGVNQALKSGKGTPVGQTNTYQAGWNAAKEKLKNHPLFMERSVTSLSGEVISINGDRLSLKTAVQSMNPLADPMPAQRTVILTNETVIIKRIPKTSEQMQTDMQLFNKQREDAMKTREAGMPNGMVMPPNPYIDETITLNEIQIGDSVMVEAVDNNDIGYASEFTASRLVVQSR